MHPCISKFPNAKFYDNRISDDPVVKQEGYARSYLPGPIYGAYSFIHIENDMEMLDNLGQSSKNMVEVAIATNIVERLAKGTTLRIQLSSSMLEVINIKIFGCFGALINLLTVV